MDGAHTVAAAIHRRAPAAAAAEQRDAIGPHVESSLDIRCGFVTALRTLHAVARVRLEVAVGKERVALPAAGHLAALQAPFDEDLLALLQVLREALRLLSPQVDVVPLGAFLPLAGL